MKAAEPNPHQLPRNPSSAKECAICHYRWVDTFFLDGRGTDLVPLQTEPVVGTSGMCFSCHDGSVLDSRWAFEKEHGHRTGVPPPEGISLPKNLPLDSKGHVQCITCHSPHGVPNAMVEDTSAFLRLINTNSAMCLICHPTLAGNSAGNNHPLGQVTNTIPQALWSRRSTPEMAAHLITCETCHTPHGDPQENLLKQPVSDSTLCLTCHSDKNPINADGSRNFFHGINIIPTNAVIPASLITNGARLGKNGAVTCLSCHKVHQNKIEKHLLVAKVDNQSTFCLNCHRDKQGLTLTKHNLANAFPDAKNLAGQSVSDSGPCSACHLPHQNAQPVAGKGDRVASTCLSCHGPAGIASKTNLLGRSHPIDVGLPAATTMIAARTTPRSLPLYDALRNRTADGKVGCLTCHDPHKAQPDNSPQGSAKFLRKTYAGLCQECHPDQVNVLNTKHDLTRVAPTVRNVRGQTPSETGSCGACHLVHSANDSTWARTLPPSPKSSDQCLSCHQSGGVAEKKLIGRHSHPVDVPLREPCAQTTLPLDMESSQTNTAGKITCATCHDPHRWDPSRVASAQHLTEGTMQDSFLRLPASPAPRLCADCHPNESSVVGTEHDLALFHPDNPNIVGQRAAETGPCGACHLVHNAPIEARLWAREFKLPAAPLWASQPPPWARTPLVNVMCNACHSSKAIAGNKVQAFSYHPPVTAINLSASETHDRVFFPLFDPSSSKLVTAETISCSSCHNVHRWSAQHRLLGPGLNLEGDSNNSFLRHRSAELSCKVCHGLDAIYRYQYYHKSSTHRGKGIRPADDFIP